jgi:hypothetical protein
LAQRYNHVCCDHIIQSFEAACRAGELETAASLLTDIDSSLLGAKPDAMQREAALRRMRALRTRLEVLRARPGAAIRRALFGQIALGFTPAGQAARS